MSSISAVTDMIPNAEIELDKTDNVLRDQRNNCMHSYVAGCLSLLSLR